MSGLNDVASKIAKEHSITVSSAKILIADTLDTIIELSAESPVRIGKHTFKTVLRAARTCRNPHTGESIEVGARNVVTYKHTKTKETAIAPPPEPKKKTKK
jgi:DNA-binding protein HU-beta